MEGHGDRGSSTPPSSLSAFAQPFNPQPSSNWVANSCQQPCRPSQDGSLSSDSSFSLVGSFHDLNLEGDSVLVDAPRDAYKYCGHQSEMGITDFPSDNPPGFDFDFVGQSIYSSCHPSLALQENSMSAVPYDSEFDAMSLTESSVPGYTQNLLGFDYVCQRADGSCNAEQDKKRDNQGSLVWKAGSKASGNFQKQALQKKVNVTAPQKKVIVTAPQQALHAAKGLNPCDETSDNINKCGNLTVMILGGDNQMKSGGAEQETAESFPKPNSTVTPFEFSTSSDTCSAATLQNIPQVNADLPGINVLNNNVNSSGCNSEELSGLNGCNPISLKKPHVLLNTKGKEVYLDKSLIENGDERKGDKLISDDGLKPLCTVKSELQRHGIKPGVSIEISKTLDENDSDVDSPCWKGTLACWQSPFGVSECVSSQCLEKKLKASNILNPLAPHFFPSNAKGSIDYYHESECGISDFSSFDKGESSVVYFGNAGSTNVGSNPSGLSCGIGTECSIDINESKKEYSLVNNSRSSSFLNSSHIFQPSLVEDCCASNGRLVIGENAEDSLNGIKDVVHSGSTRVPVLAKEHDLGPSSSSGVGLLNDLNETHQSVSKSLSAPLKIDVRTVINTVRNLSELLVQNCSNGLYSLNEHEHDIIQLIIDKLHVLSTNRAGQGAPMPEPTQTGTPYSPCKATEHCKSSSMQFRVAWAKTMSVPDEPENQNYHDGQKSCYTAFTEKGLNCFSSYSDVGVEKSNEIIQVISKGLTENHQIVEDMHPQALVYRNLWLEAEAALCGLKYRTCALSMKSNGMDGYESIKRRC
ncbi:uncharacterized protein LOC121236873 isoform X2 [Juglans microcarpa x Juglans regia]|uniref:uncharacterized protein LOC121236873 isoform X2 n=1 Tax=Juglans microcarpa x Juglans regia TaxID=2249226 RepID=UPI001B7DB868|nr:uncharacterized protein LOC121236873 isoform X2 [Juglans microcarpa x Juglans regia]